MLKNVKKKMHFTLQLMFHLTVQSRGAPEGILDCTLSDTLSNVHKDDQERAFQVALVGELEIPFELHLWLHLLLMQSFLMHECVQNSSSNGGPNAVLEVVLVILNWKEHLKVLFKSN